MEKFKALTLWTALVSGSLLLAAWSQEERFLRPAMGEGYWSCPPFCRMTQGQIEAVFKEWLPASDRAKSALLASKVLDLSKQYKLDSAFILSVISAESSFNPRAVSPKGAVGLMQLMPDTAQFIAGLRKIPYSGDADLSDPARNLHYGVAYLDHLRTYYRGDFTKMLVAYNMGPGRLDEYIREKGFRLVQSKPYVDGIRRGASYWRVYGLGGTRPKNALTEVRGWLRDHGV